MRVIGLAGWSGAGKTTLLLKLIPHLGERGVSVSTLKHAHHAFEIDHPGKDSFEHRRAGAHEVLVASGRRWALMHELRDEAEPGLPKLLRKLSPVDLVMVEGFKAWGHPKIEVHRTANGKPFLYDRVPNVRAVATDGPGPDAGLPVLDLSDVAGIAESLLALADPLESILDALDAEPIPPRIRLPF
jgi:molybdopterin-guanine dinucleotide biosynthesis protein B